MADHGIEYEITTLKEAYKHIRQLEKEISEANARSNKRIKKLEKALTMIVEGNCGGSSRGTRVCMCCTIDSELAKKALKP